MSPIQFGSWAQLWVIGVALHAGGGLRLQTEAGILRAQVLPIAAQRMSGQRSGLSWEQQRIQIHLGQTPYGPGYSVHSASSTSRFLAFVGPDFRWVQWTGPPLQLLTQASWSSQGIRLEGQFQNWSYALAPQGLSYLGWNGLQTHAKLRLAPGRWEGTLRIFRAQLTLSGHPYWSNSRFRLEHQGRFVELSEMHSTRGLQFQAMGRLPLKTHCLSFSYALPPWPSWIAYQYQTQHGPTAHIQWSSQPMFRRWSLGFPMCQHKCWVGLGQNVAGSHLEVRWKGVQGTFRPGQWSLRMNHHWGWNPRPKKTLVESSLEPPQLHILTAGDVDHPVFDLHILDSEGRRFGLHIVRGSHQWKNHLPPGSYHWPAQKTRPLSGWIVLISEQTFELRAGEICHLPILIQRDMHPIYWLPPSVGDANAESPIP